MTEPHAISQPRDHHQCQGCQSQLWWEQWEPHQAELQGERGGGRDHSHHLPPLLPHHSSHPQPLQGCG